MSIRQIASITAHELEVNSQNGPRFRSRKKLSRAQLTDPDYALKQIKKLNGGKLDITCSKCHHCR